MKRLVLGICLALVGGAAFSAVPTGLDAVAAREKACETRANGVNPSTAECFAQADKAADQILNRLYAEWTAKLKHPPADEAKDSAEILNRLVASERAWIGYRDTTCHLESAIALNGTAEGLEETACLYQTTRQRVLDLHRVYDNR